VASNVGGLPDIVQDGVNGFTCPPGDVDGMAARAVMLLTDADLRARLAANAVDLVRSTYCTERIVPLYEAAYRRVLAGAGRSS
jgi:glycosyltransferase involved in cell wall biosynthesis